MTHSLYRHPFERYDVLKQAGATPQTFSTRALALLEADFRAIALLALADWSALDLIEPEFFGAVGALQRPSWGTWNFVLQSLRNARKVQLRTGQVRVRELVESARTLQMILAALDANASSQTLDAVRPLARLLGDKARLKRIADVVALPIALRNQVAHFPPVEGHEWEAIASALAPYVEWFATDPFGVLGEPREWPEPWFVREGDELWTFNGVEKELAPLYAPSWSGRPKSFPDRTSSLVRALERLLGRSDRQDMTFHRLLARLAPEDIKGVVLGDFLVGPPVGAGGFATVHVGRQLSTGRKVAMKLLHDGLGEQARARFQQEAEFLSRIAEPAVVGVISHGEDAWTLPRFVNLDDQTWFQELARGSAIKSYIALEWIDGRTLEDLFQAIYVAKSEPAPELAVIRSWFKTAARALVAVHAAGVVHRDVKPGNFMIDVDGQLHLMDFGIARSDDENRTLATSTGYALGTPPYMSPEQIRAHDAEAEVGPASDLYSLCASFYELVTGRRFFGHDEQHLESIKTRKLAGEMPPKPTMFVKGLPWELETILLGGLRPELADRYQRADAIVRDLEHWERDEPLEYRRPSFVRRAALAYRRNRTIAKLALSFTLLVTAGVVVYIYNVQSARALAETQRQRAESEKQRAEKLRDESDRSRAQLLLDAAREKVLAGELVPAAKLLDEALEIVSLDRVPVPILDQVAATLPAPSWTGHGTASNEPFGFDASGQFLFGTAHGVTLDVATGAPRAAGDAKVVSFAARSSRTPGDWPALESGDELTDASGRYRLRVVAPYGTVKKGETSSTIDSHCDALNVGQVLPDGFYVATCDCAHCGHRRLVIARGANYMEVDSNVREATALPLAASADGRTILYWKDRLWLFRNETLWPFDSQNNQDQSNAGRAFDADPDTTLVALSGDAALAGSTGKNGTIAIWDTVTLRQIGAVHMPATVTRLAFSADHRRLAAMDSAGNVAVWELSRLPATIRATNGIAPTASVLGVRFTDAGPRWLFHEGGKIVARSPTGDAAISVNLPSSANPRKDDGLSAEMDRSGALVVVHKKWSGDESFDGDTDVVTSGGIQATIGDTANMFVEGAKALLLEHQLVDLATGARVPIQWSDDISYFHECANSQTLVFCIGVFKTLTTLSWFDIDWNPIAPRKLELPPEMQDPGGGHAIALDADRKLGYVAGCGRQLHVYDLAGEDLVGDVDDDESEDTDSDDSDEDGSDDDIVTIDLKKAACALSIELAGSTALIARDDDRAIVVDLAQREVAGSIRLNGGRNVTVSDTGRFVAVASKKDVLIFDRTTLVQVARREFSEDVSTVEFGERDDESLYVVTERKGYLVHWRDVTASKDQGWRSRIKALKGL